jgi:hypothetical protein
MSLSTRLARLAAVGGLLAISVVFPVSASASAGQPSLTSIETCLALAQTPVSLSQAQACAPGAPVVTSAHAAGTYILKGSRGYSILQVSTRVTNAPSGCAFREFNLLDGGGLHDWMGSTFCWGSYYAWVSGTPQLSCNPWGPPGAFCNGNRYQIQGQYSYPKVTLFGYFYQTCGFIFSCNDAIWVDSYWDGHYNAGSWEF